MTQALWTVVAIGVGGAILAWTGAEAALLASAGCAALLVLAPLLALWHTSRLELGAPDPGHAFVGVNYRIAIEVFNRSTVATARDLLFYIDDGRRGSMTATGQLPAIPPGRSSRATAVPRFSERGRRTALRVRVESSFPFGLFRSEAVFLLPLDLLVLPRLGRLGNLERRIRPRGGRVLDAPRGTLGEGEFYGLRDWREGEPLRGIHWKLSARRGRLLLREVRSQDRPEVRVVLSAWVETNAPPERRVPSFERAVSLTATIVEHFLRRGHTLELELAGPVPARLTGLRGRASLLPALALLAETRHEPGDPARAVESASSGSRSTFPIVVVAGGAAWEERPPPEDVLLLDVDGESGVEVFDGMQLPSTRPRRSSTLPSWSR